MQCGIQRSAASKLLQAQNRKGGCFPRSVPLPPLSCVPTGWFLPDEKGGGEEGEGREEPAKPKHIFAGTLLLKCSFCFKTNC